MNEQTAAMLENTAAPQATEAVEATAATPWRLPFELDFSQPLVPIVIAVAAVLLLAALTTGLIIALRKKRKPDEEVLAEIPPTEAMIELPLVLYVGKAHGQGARSEQQDCFSVSRTESDAAGPLLAVVADGMGGLKDGGRVSQCVVSTMMSKFYFAQGSAEHILLDLTHSAVEAVNAMLGEKGRRMSGSTMVTGMVRDGRFHFLSIGDSRVCLCRGGELYILNHPHVFRRELERRAVNGAIPLVEAENNPQGGGLTSYIGMGEIIGIDMGTKGVPVREGDTFLLMTDGVFNALSDEEILTCMVGEAQEMANALEALIVAKNYPNQDNFTALVITCRRGGDAA